ncbi:class I SAM-dependent methyltransferase family protein [Candidatus Binatia bacterium]|nr:class I SAM-dependent methyltransferase family protein [Candidatus Binatia bacterium]
MSVTANVMHVLARYSEGLRLAACHGSESGIVLEYAYENVPQGSGALGRWIDRTFLQLRRCDALRRRVDLTREMVAGLIADRRTNGRRTVILDVAAGTGRYLRELARSRKRGDLVIRCLDRNPHEVMLGRQLVNREGLSDFDFEVGDATDDASYLMRDDPDIILAIDLFPYLHDDMAVRTVMAHSFSHLAPKGLFVCTGAGPDTTVRGSEHWGGSGFQLAPLMRKTAAIESWMAAAGFTAISSVAIGDGHMALLGEKHAVQKFVGDPGKSRKAAASSEAEPRLSPG